MSLELTLQWRFADGCEPPLCIGDILQIEVRANQPCDGYYLQFDGDSDNYFYPSQAIVHGEKAVINLRPKPKKTIFDLQPITLNLIDKTNTTVAIIQPTLRVRDSGKRRVLL